MSATELEYTEEFIKNVKERISEEIEKSPEEFDSILYKQWLSDENLFLRYVKRKRGDLNGTITFLLEILRWRKKNSISTLTELSFPKEFYDFGGIHVYGFDREGNSICHVRLRFFHKQQEILELLKKFAVFQMFKADELGASRGKGWVLLFDCTGSGVANADIEMVNFVNSTLRNYFPSGQVYVLSHNLPWLLSAIKSVVFTMLPSNVKKRIKFSTDKTIEDFIEKSSLPPYMGGTCNQIYPAPAPRGVLTTAEMAKEKILSLTSDEELKIEKYYEKINHEIKNSVKSK